MTYLRTDASVIRQTKENSGDLTASQSSCKTTSLTRKLQVGAPRFSRKFSLMNSYSWLLVEAKQKCLLFEILCSFLIYFRANFNLGSSQAINYMIFWLFNCTFDLLVYTFHDLLEFCLFVCIFHLFVQKFDRICSYARIVIINISTLTLSG